MCCKNLFKLCEYLNQVINSSWAIWFTNILSTFFLQTFFTSMPYRWGYRKKVATFWFIFYSKSIVDLCQYVSKIWTPHKEVFNFRAIARWENPFSLNSNKIYFFLKHDCHNPKQCNLTKNGYKLSLLGGCWQRIPFN